MSDGADSIDSANYSSQINFPSSKGPRFIGEAAEMAPTLKSTTKLGITADLNSWEETVNPCKQGHKKTAGDDAETFPKNRLTAHDTASVEDCDLKVRQTPAIRPSPDHQTASTKQNLPLCFQRAGPVITSAYRHASLATRLRWAVVTPARRGKERAGGTALPTKELSGDGEAVVACV
ncbi:hypothetical protein BaRGS_00006838 [Batillaria attramentaria]|uniref:Uncharacterized protein n=1 Tax=Batillaria attramentaria TaxID=370345 RepID=A0ABD0LSE6_9CAEN